MGRESRRDVVADGRNLVARTWRRFAAIALLALFGTLGASAAVADTASPVFRFYNTITGTHFYTISTTERDIVLANWPQFVFEGTVFYAYVTPTSDTLPVFRFFDTSTSTHFYTQSTSERDLFLATRPTFLYEGPVYYAPFQATSSSAALYRFFNTRTNAWFYTDSTTDRDIVLANWPWFQLQGIGYYVFTTPNPTSTGAPGVDNSIKATLALAQGGGPGEVELTATATDSDQAISRVDIAMDGSVIGTGTRSPFSLDYNVTVAGTHAFTAVAYDSQGAKGTSAPVSFTLPGAVTPPPPPSTTKVTLVASPATVNVGDTVTLTATPSTATGTTVTKVDFFVGGTALGTDTTAPYSVTYKTTAPGTASFTAKVTDSKGATATSAAAPVTVAAPTVSKPKVTLASSVSTAQVPASIVLTATATDTGGTITKVSFYRNGVLLGNKTSAPFTYTDPLTLASTYSYTATAIDNLGASATSTAVSVTTTAPPPTVTLSASATTVSLGNSVTLTATPASTGSTIAKVTFLANGTAIGTATAAPYTLTYKPTATGTLSFTATATDLAGSTGTSTAKSVSVTPATASTPKVTLSVSSTLQQVPAAITLTANTSDTGGTITKVMFYRNGALISTKTATPYVFTDNLTTADTYTYTATAVDNKGVSASSGAINVTTTTPPPVVSANADAWRLLTQASFGPTPADLKIASAKGGITSWINQQMSQPISGYPDSVYDHIQLSATPDCTTTDPTGKAYPPTAPQAQCARDQLTLNMLQRNFFTNAVSKPDQLRQRVAWALSQIVVTSAQDVNDLSYAYVMSRYQNILFNNALGNYETLLQQVTLSPAMGNYLSWVNNDRPAGTREPNQNYAREVMQLFSIGLAELNDDGTPLLDTSGNTIPTYEQDDIAQMANVFTGWTYANANGKAITGKNYTGYYATPMQVYPGTATSGHETAAKTLFGGDVGTVVIPAGQTPQADINSAIHAVFMHPNTPAFVSKQLIQHLVEGNPTPAYVARISAVFKNNGKGVRGDLGAVVKAILLDTEARGATVKPATFGSLREPVLVLTSLIRSLSGVTDGNSLGDQSNALGQRPFYSPTVFNFYQPDTTVTGSSLNEPEFGIHNSTTAVARANMVFNLVYYGIAPNATIPSAVGTKLNTQQFESLADNPASLVAQVNTVMMGGMLPDTAAATIATAVGAIPASTDPKQTQWRTDRSHMAVYLMASSYYYQVQH